jgi:hypothetical protein
MGYWITKSFQLREKLLVVIGWDKDRHTGDNIKAKTLEGLHKTWSIGQSPADVPSRVFGSTPDEGSNMLKAWNVFEGSACVAHRASTALGYALKVNCEAMALVKKIKGIISHFHKSTKVMC